MRFSYLLVRLFVLIALVHPPAADATDSDFFTTPTYPATVLWNTNLNADNYLECFNGNDIAVTAQLTLYQSSGDVIGSATTVTINANETRHFALSTLGAPANAFGSLEVDLAQSSQGYDSRFVCYLSVYRFDQGTRGVDFAYSLLLEAPVSGTPAGIYNSFNAAGNSRPTNNYLSIMYPGSESFSGVVELYDITGQKTRELPFGPLSSNQRIDIALGHDQTENNGQQTGLFRIVPGAGHDETEFYALLMRYGMNDSGEYRFALPLTVNESSCGGQPLYFSTYSSERVWLEIGNSIQSDVPAEIFIMSRSGELLHREQRVVSGRTQTHINIDSLVGSNQIGQVFIDCDDDDEELPTSASEEEDLEEALVAHVINYRVEPQSNQIDWAFAIQMLGLTAERNARGMVPTNTFRGMANWLRTTERDNQQTELSITLYGDTGSAAATTDVTLAPQTGQDVDLHSMLGTDRIGTTIVESDSGQGQFAGTLFRVFMSADQTQFTTLMPIRQSVLPAAAPTFVVPAENISQTYLMVFHGCDPNQFDCMGPDNNSVYLAQSNDGSSWSAVDGFQPFDGDVPDVIRRGNTLYIYSPGELRRYRFDTGEFEPPVSVTVSHTDGRAESFVDPGLVLDDQNRITLFYLVSDVNGDPARCESGQSSCTKIFRSATEVSGSDGREFIVDSGDRASTTISGTEFASDPDVFADPSGFVMYIFRGLDGTQVFRSSTLRGTYTAEPGLPDATLTGISGIPAGYYHQSSGQYWTYVHANEPGTTKIKRAVHSTLTTALSDSDFVEVIDPATYPGMHASYIVASPGFTVNQE